MNSRTVQGNCLTVYSDSVWNCRMYNVDNATTKLTGVAWTGRRDALMSHVSPAIQNKMSHNILKANQIALFTSNSILYTKIQVESAL